MVNSEKPLTKVGYPAYLGFALTVLWSDTAKRLLQAAIGGPSRALVFGGVGLSCFLLFALGRRTGKPLSSRRWLLLTVPLASAALVTVPTFIFSREMSALFAILEVLAGFSIGWLYVLWGSIYARLNIRQAVNALLTSIALSAIGAFLFSFSTLDLFGIIVCVAMPVGSVRLWQLASQEDAALPSANERFHSSGSLALFRSGILGIMVFSFALGMLLPPDSLLRTLPAYIYPLSGFISIGFCVCSLWAIRKRNTGFEFSDLWFIVLIVVAFGLVVGELGGDPLVAVTAAIIVFAHGLVLTFLYLALSDVAHNSTLGSDVVFGLGWGLYATLLALGLACRSLLAPSVSQTNIAVVAIFVLLMTLFLLLKERTPVNQRLFLELNPPLAETYMQRLTERIENIGIRSGLSEREKEIITLYAQGRSRAFIASSLFISENTVRDHIHNVYRKLHIHDKQELIDMVHPAESES